MTQPLIFSYERFELWGWELGSSRIIEEGLEFRFYVILRGALHCCQAEAFPGSLDRSPKWVVMWIEVI